MRKDKKREIFDTVLTKALGVDYSESLVSLSGSCKLPKNFPGEYGVRLYNQGIPSQSFKLLPSGIFSAEELEYEEKGDGSIFHFKEDLSIFFRLFKMNKSKA